MKRIILNKIEVNDRKVDYYFSVTKELEKYFKNDKHLFLEYNVNIENVPNSILAIPFIANIIPLIWITDSLIEISELDRSFFECLGNIKKAYQKMFPKINFKGRIKIQSLIDNTYKSEYQAASFFSGGLDALTTFVRVRDKKPLLITEYGWHSKDIVQNEVWDADRENAIRFGNAHGIENILIQSNYGSFIKANNIDADFKKKMGDTWWHGLHHGLAIISAAIPIAFQLKVECLYIASSNSPLLKVTCASDPTVDNLIKFASGSVIHDGYELSRQEKVKIVVDYFSSMNKQVEIRVCFKNEENCCKCEKCLRTIFGIIAEGKNPKDYGFNIPTMNVTQYLKNAFTYEVKFFSDTFIFIYWRITQQRMRENYNNILMKELADWFLELDFYQERRKALVMYRVKEFFPIINRKIRTKINKIVSN